MNSRTLSILVALILIGSGVAFVRPYFADRVEEAWAVVSGSMQRVTPSSDESVYLEAGAHLVFLDGPADDALWASPTLEGAWVELLDPSGNRPLPQEVDVDYEYEVNGRRGRALARTRVRYADSYSLRLTGPELQQRGFSVGIHEQEPVKEQSRVATKWRLGLWGALGAIGLCALMLFGHRK